MTVKEMEKMGFIYKHIYKNWYLCRIYANPTHKILHHVVIPLRIKGD